MIRPNPTPKSAAGARAAAAGAATALALALASCAAEPGPPPLVSDEELEAHTSTETETEAANEEKKAEHTRQEVTVGVDPVRAGFNPHLQSDEQATVRAIADLVLPSAFTNGELNTDLLVSAERLDISPTAMSVRYVITPEAQWSDGAPISGADFLYLWRGMTTTPGTVDPAGYDAIADIRVSGGDGKTVEVDFTQEMAHYQELFTHLLPSHLLNPDASDFATALRDAVPASAGRFLFSGVDGGRGTITLNRNDRFWGTDPAEIDILNLQTVRGTTSLADQLRAGQLSFVDKTPEETTLRTFFLLPGTQTQLVWGPRSLGVNATTALSPAARRELFSLIDVPLLASIATGRSADLFLPEARKPLKVEAGALGVHVGQRGPLKVAADPADPAAGAAARSLVDLLNRLEVPAVLVSEDTATIMGKLVPAGGADVVVGWRLETNDAAQVAGRALCPKPEFRAANVSGYCTEETEALAAGVLDGSVEIAEAEDEMADIEYEQSLWMPILHESRVLSLGEGIVGPDPDLAVWPGGFETAAVWRAVEKNEPKGGMQ